jgi:hypothetical protein
VLSQPDLPQHFVKENAKLPDGVIAAHLWMSVENQFPDALRVVSVKVQVAVGVLAIAQAAVILVGEAAVVVVRVIAGNSA